MIVQFLYLQQGYEFIKNLNKPVRDKTFNG